MANAKYHTVPNGTRSDRLEVIEDEVKALESMLDARTRKLWAEVAKLQAEVKELQDRNVTPTTANAKEFQG